MLERLYNKKYIKYFVILQPILDLLTAFMKKQMHMTFTIGMFVRSIFLLYAVVYLLIVDKKKKKWNWGIISVIGIYCIINILINYSVVNNYNFVLEITNLIKFAYFPCLLLFFRQFFQEKGTTSLKPFVISSLIISGSIFLGQLTGHVYYSYGSGNGSKIGHSGWFFAANEVSGIFAILFPLVLYGVLKYKKAFNFFVFGLCIYAMLMLGTKAAYAALLLTLLGYFFFKLFRSIVFKERNNKFAISFLALSIIFTIAITPSAPIYHNMSIHLKRLNIPNIKVLFKHNNIFKNGYNSNHSEKEIIEQEKEIIEQEKKKNEQEKISNLIYNGREKVLSEINKSYNNSNALQKVFGMSFSVDHYSAKILERDFHDLYYFYGTTGFVIIIIFIFFFISVYFIEVITNIKNNLNDKSFAMLLSVFLTLSMSYIAGHILLSPAVSTYLAMIMPMLYHQLKKEE